MIRYSTKCFLSALVAAIIGFTSVSANVTGIKNMAQLVCVIFSVLFIVAVIGRTVPFRKK